MTKDVRSLEQRTNQTRKNLEIFDSQSFFTRNKQLITGVTIIVLALVIAVMWYIQSSLPRLLSISQESFDTEEQINLKEEFALAEYSDKYPHGALGDDFEPTVILKTDSTVEDEPFITLPDDQVFEATRLIRADVLGDEAEEIIVTVSDQNQGAANYIYDSVTGEVVAQTEFIGERFRWRMLVGVIHDSRGKPYLVDVVTPHLTGTLTLYEIKGDGIVPIDQKEGYFSHEYGSSSMDGANIIDAGERQVLRITPDFESWEEFAVERGTFVTVEST